MPYKDKNLLYRNQVARWIRRKKEAVDYMGGKCTECGYNKHYAAMHFHHLDPFTKEFNWAKLRLKSWDKIYKELEKCVLLCANCHAIKHSLSSS